MTTTLRDTCRQLLRDGKVDEIIGYGQEPAGRAAGPFNSTRAGSPSAPGFSGLHPAAGGRQPTGLERRCYANLAVYLKRRKSALWPTGDRGQGMRSTGPGRVGKGIATRPLAGLRDRHGLRRMGRPKCWTCDVHEPRGVDVDWPGGRQCRPDNGRAALRRDQRLSGPIVRERLA